MFNDLTLWPSDPPPQVQCQPGSCLASSETSAGSMQSRKPSVNLNRTAAADLCGMPSASSWRCGVAGCQGCAAVTRFPSLCHSSVRVQLTARASRCVVGKRWHSSHCWLVYLLTWWTWLLFFFFFFFGSWVMCWLSEIEICPAGGRNSNRNFANLKGLILNALFILCRIWKRSFVSDDWRDWMNNNTLFIIYICVIDFCTA